MWPLLPNQLISTVPRFSHEFTRCLHIAHCTHSTCNRYPLTATLPTSTRMHLSAQIWSLLLDQLICTGHHFSLECTRYSQVLMCTCAHSKLQMVNVLDCHPPREHMQPLSAQMWPLLLDQLICTGRCFAFEFNIYNV